MRHNSFQKIYASYIAPDPEMDVLWMDLTQDPYGSVIKFWNGGTDKYELISSDASTIGKHIIYADDVEKSTRSILNFKGFEILDNQPLDLMTISVENKENSGVAQSIMDSHALEFDHEYIHHSNRAALDNVSGINTGDQDLSVIQSQIDEKADSSVLESYVSSIGAELNNKVDKIYGHSLISDADKARLSLTSGTNTGDQDLSGLVEKIYGHSLVPDTEINKLAVYPELENLEFSHANLSNKNSEAAFQHVDTTTVKEVLGATDMIAIKDGVTGKFVLSNALNVIAESESSRNQAEIIRETNEGERIIAEDQRILNEQARVAAGYLTSQEVSKIKRLTQAQYDALNPKDSTTLYLIIQV